MIVLLVVLHTTSTAEGLKTTTALTLQATFADINIAKGSSVYL